GDRAGARGGEAVGGHHLSSPSADHRRSRPRAETDPDHRAEGRADARDRRRRAADRAVHARVLAPDRRPLHRGIPGQRAERERGADRPRLLFRRGTRGEPGQTGGGRRALRLRRARHRRREDPRHPRLELDRERPHRQGVDARRDNGHRAHLLHRRPRRHRTPPGAQDRLPHRQRRPAERPLSRLRRLRHHLALRELRPLLRERDEHRRPPDTLRKLRRDHREPHLRLRLQRLRRHGAALLPRAAAPRAAVPFGAGADESDPDGHRALAPVLLPASDQPERPRSGPFVTDAVLALILIAALFGAVAAVRFFRTLDAIFWRDAATPVMAGLVAGAIFFFVSDHYVVIGIVLTIAALYVRLTGRESEPGDGMLLGALTGAASTF